MTRVLDFLPLLLGAPESASTGAAGGATTGGMPIWTTLIMFGLIIVVFYFLMIRPQNKKQKETKKMLESLRKGDRVSTIGGMRGSVVSVKEDVVLLKVDDNTKLEFSKSAIAQVLERKEEPEDAKELKKE